MPDSGPETVKTQTQKLVDKAAADAEARQKKKEFRAELRALQAQRSILVNKRAGMSSRIVEQLNPHELKDLEQQGAPKPAPFSPEQNHRLWELHYLAAGLPVPVRDDLDD